MKSLHKTLAMILPALASLGLMCACHTDEPGDATILLPFVNSDISYDTATGAWTGCFDADKANNLNYVDFHFSHVGLTTPEYRYFEGFCPTVSTDVKSYDTTAEWLSHQWSSIAGGSATGFGPYMVAKWAEYMEPDPETVPENPSCAITTNNGALFKPTGCYVSNSSWGYYAIKDGTEMSDPFGYTDTFTLYIIGSRQGKITGMVTVDLAARGEILKDWYPVGLKQLGIVDMIYFRMSSTQSNQWGILNPTYFCLDGFMFEFV